MNLLKNRIAAMAFLTLCLLFAGTGFVVPLNHARAPILPTRDYYVNDGAGILSADDKRKILAAASELYDKTRAQVVVLTVATEYGDQSVLDDFAGLIFTGWEIGGREEENGVLMLISSEPEDCVLRVGQGLLPVFSPEKRQEIRERILSAMRDGKISKSVKDGFGIVVTQIYSSLGVEPGEKAISLLEDEKSFGLTPLIMLAGGLFLLGRAMRIGRGSRKYLSRGPIRKRRSFSSRLRSEDAAVRETAGQGPDSAKPTVEVYPVTRETYLDDYVQ